MSNKDDRFYVFDVLFRDGNWKTWGIGVLTAIAALVVVGKNGIEKKFIKTDNDIKNTMCHSTLKGGVCKGTRVLDAQEHTPHLSVEFLSSVLDITKTMNSTYLAQNHFEQRYDCIRHNRLDFAYLDMPKKAY